jgi:hypothetical protein
VLEPVFILLEFPSPSRRIFIGSHSLPPSLVRRIGPSYIHEQPLKYLFMDEYYMTHFGEDKYMDDHNA